MLVVEVKQRNKHQVLREKERIAYYSNHSRKPDAAVVVHHNMTYIVSQVKLGCSLIMNIM